MFNWRDYLVPERAVQSAFRIFAVIVIGLIALALFCGLIAASRVSVFDLLALALLWLVASLPAYAVREARKPRRPERRGGSVERIPLVPVDLEDEE